MVEIYNQPCFCACYFADKAGEHFPPTPTALLSFRSAWYVLLTFLAILLLGL